MRELNHNELCEINGGEGIFAAIIAGIVGIVTPVVIYAKRKFFEGFAEGWNE